MVHQKQLHKGMSVAKLVGNVATCGVIPSEADKNQEPVLCVAGFAAVCPGEGISVVWGNAVLPVSSLWTVACSLLMIHHY